VNEEDILRLAFYVYLNKPLGKSFTLTKEDLKKFALKSAKFEIINNDFGGIEIKASK